MAKFEKSVWARLQKAGIISTYDKELRNEQIRKAGPYKLMKIRGIGPRAARILLKNAGWDISLQELETIYSKLEFRTDYESVKAKPKKEEWIKEKPKEAASQPAQKEKPKDEKQRRYIALTIKTSRIFKELFNIVKKSKGIPYNGIVPHKIPHLTAAAPANILFKDILAKFYGITNYQLPITFTATSAGTLQKIPKAMFFGKLDIPFKLVFEPHLTFAEFDSFDECKKFCDNNREFLNKLENTKMEIESLAIIKKDYGIEYAIPVKAINKEDRKFIPEEIKAFIDFLGHKNPIKYQVFRKAVNGKSQGSGRNTYVRNADEVINLAKKDNSKGIICVAISEHGSKQTEDITNIARILALTIDVDVKKDRKINYVSSKADHLHAINIAYTFVKKELEEMGFRVGLINDSGNGAHVFVKISIKLPENLTKEDWLNSEIYAKLISLEAKIREKLNIFNDEIVNIDFITKDVVRRIKIPGTINAKDQNQAEDRICRIIYKTDNYAEEKNNKAFAKIKPTEIEKVKAAETISLSGERIDESEPVVNDKKVMEIINTNPRMKALFEGNIDLHGEDKPLKFEKGRVSCKSRSEAELALLTDLIRNGITNFSQIDEIMLQAKIGKWQEDRTGQYRRTTYLKAKGFIKTRKISITDTEVVDSAIDKIKKLAKKK